MGLGLAVLGVFYTDDMESKDPPLALAQLQQGFACLQSDYPLTIQARRVQKRGVKLGGSGTCNVELELRALLPENLNAVYRYGGSLTTPPYSETVVWTIFAQHAYVSLAQVWLCPHP